MNKQMLSFTFLIAMMVLLVHPVSAQKGNVWTAESLPQQGHINRRPMDPAAEGRQQCGPVRRILHQRRSATQSGNRAHGSLLFCICYQLREHDAWIF